MRCAALEHASLGVECCARWGHLTNLLDSYAVLASVQRALGQSERAQAPLNTARELARASLSALRDAVGGRHRQLQQMACVLDALQARVWLDAGELERVSRWLAGYRGDDPLPYLIRSRLYVRQGKPDEALRIVDGALNEAGEGGSVPWRLELLGLRACVLYEQGEPGAALDTLAQALALGEPGGYVRSLVDAGEPMVDLMRVAAARGLAPEYVGRVLAAFPGEEQDAPRASITGAYEALSERELEVLRLIAAHQTNQAIKDERIVAMEAGR